MFGNILKCFFFIQQCAVFVKRQAIRKHITFETFKEFSERVKSTLYAMNTVLIDNIISSMDKRLQLIIQHKGKRTKY